MRFDDRLQTVLRQPAGTPHDAAVRWRQLVDLVARSGPADDSPALVEALGEIRAAANDVEESLRAAAARAVAALPIPFRLLEIFAEDRVSVSAPVLAAANLSDAEWSALAARVGPETRRFIEALHPALSQQSPSDYTEQLVETAPAPPSPAPSPPGQRPAGRSLADVVARIERRRQRRNQAAQRSEAGRAAATKTFRWECGPGGEIRWVEGAPRGALIGRSIASLRAAAGEGADSQVVRAFALRSPFRDAAFTIGGEGALAGEWVLSGVPAFEPADGRFVGYRGIAQRRDTAGHEDSTILPALGDPASLRELVHEIKTPLNAIIGFAEIIDGQYLGPADRPYRRRAAYIVSQARILLEAIDDLDFAAKARSSSGASGAKTPLGPIVERVSAEIADGQLFDLARSASGFETSVASELAERIVRRTLRAVAAACAPGERLRVAIERSGDRLRLSIARPDSLRSLTIEQLFGAGKGAEGAQLALRLARSLARIAGVRLVAGERDIGLLFERG